MRSKHEILLSQWKYVLIMLFETRKLGAKPCSTPMAHNVKLTKKGELLEDPERYRRLVRKLNYFAISCPDIADSISVLSQYISSPTLGHWAAVDHILCYLKEASRRGILYKKHGHTRIECFLDED